MAYSGVTSVHSTRVCSKIYYLNKSVLEDRVPNFLLSTAPGPLKTSDTLVLLCLSLLVSFSACGPIICFQSFYFFY